MEWFFRSPAVQAIAGFGPGVVAVIFIRVCRHPNSFRQHLQRCLELDRRSLIDYARHAVLNRTLVVLLPFTLALAYAPYGSTGTHIGSAGAIAYVLWRVAVHRQPPAWLLPNWMDEDLEHHVAALTDDGFDEFA